METPPELLFGTTPASTAPRHATGRLRHVFDDDFYVIDDVDALPGFLISLVSDADHWLYVVSTGGLTAGRRDPAGALFPYVTEDKLADAAGVTGPLSQFVVTRAGHATLWRPLHAVDPPVYQVTRRLYKNVLGNRLIFEEENTSLGVCFRAEWQTSERFGFVRECTLVNLANTPVTVQIADGLLNLLPGDVSEQLQLGYSSLVDAFKQHERVAGSTLALYTLAAQVVDRPQPAEALHATVVWSDGLPSPAIALVEAGRLELARGGRVVDTGAARGQRGAYLLGSEITIAATATHSWLIVADVGRTQRQVVELIRQLRDPTALVAAVRADVALGRARLEHIVAGTDGLQCTADRLATGHHVANVLFNDMRGGVFAHGAAIPGPDFAAFVAAANRSVHARHRALLADLPELEPHHAHHARVTATADPDLIRLAAEYLPLTFSRRHGDPSRPWNRFEISLRDGGGEALLDYQGNWRDIFQNWEALGCGNPEFLEQLVAKFVNASTVDGHNPYRIARAGVDWETPDPDHPWATIGYWGDHQIVYLSRLVELARDHHPGRLSAMLEREQFVYADVPYELRPFEDILADPRRSIRFDAAKHARIVARIAELGSDARLVHDAAGIYRVTLVEKLLVPALAKLAGFVPGGGVWMNTQRPEWNDANNALAGYGVSMVTACYLERYLAELPGLLAALGDRATPLSNEVAGWLDATLAALDANPEPLASPAARWRLVTALGRAAGSYRAAVYRGGFTGKRAVPASTVRQLVARGRSLVQHTITEALNRPPRGGTLFPAYGVLVPRPAGEPWEVEPLGDMLEGQVAALSTHTLDDTSALALLDALRRSRLYRADHESYLLYPDRTLPTFLDKNVIPAAALERTPALRRWLATGDRRIIERDADGRCRFVADLANAEVLAARLRSLAADDRDDAVIAGVLAAYEEVFAHRAFTGRSGAMFAYEGLGSIYWHMVGKLALATQERYLAAAEAGADPDLLERLARHYEAIRTGMSGVNKSPTRWGAFPLDPYSHTPGHGGARQPGMTGQVKEEILIRLGELGVRVRGGCVSFTPRLLRRAELLTAPEVFEPIAVDGRRLQLPLDVGTLAFTYCQVPVVYRLARERRIRVIEAGGRAVEILGDRLDAEASAAVFRRDGRVHRIEVDTEPGRG
jgi:hypothetical protein